MKKILALVLALVMTMSLVTISSSAAELSDVDSATYSEAINVVSGLGIINGYADGTFRPQADLTRGAATKFVSIAKLGATVANALPGDTSFSDVAATSTFAPYVAYCVENGIVNGYADGTFQPEAKLTGYAYLKMLLGAIGVEGEFTGAGWALRVAVAASEAGLTEGLEAFDGNKNITREEAALCTFNALMYTAEAGNTGDWAYDSNLGVWVQRPGSVDGSLYAEVFGGAIDYVLVTTNDANSTLAYGSTSGLLVNYNAVTGAATGFATAKKYNVASSADMIGHVAKVYYKTAAVVPTAGYTTYAVADASTVYTFDALSAAALTDATKIGAAFGIDAPAAAITTAKNFTNYVVGAGSNDKITTTTVAAGTYVKFADKFIYMSAVPAVDEFFVTITNFDKGYYTVGTTAGGNDIVKYDATTATNKDVAVYDGTIDWKAMVTTGNTAKALFVATTCGDKVVLSDVKTVEGKVTKLGTDIYVDGVKYEVSAAEASMAASAIPGAITTLTNANLDFTNTFKFYLNAAGKIFAAVKVTAEDTNAYQLAYVLGTIDVKGAKDAYGVDSWTYNVQYYTLDGAVKTATYATFDGAYIDQVTSAAYNTVQYAAKSGWYLLTEGADGVGLKSLGGTTGYSTASFDVDSITGANANKLVLTAGSTNIDGKFINNNTTFLYAAATGMSAYNKDATVVKGAHSNTLTTTDGVAKTIEMVVVANASNTAKSDIVAAFVSEAANGTVDQEIVYVAAYEGQVSAGTKPTYSFSIVKADGSKDSLVVTTSNDVNQTAQFKQLVKATDGSYSFAAPVAGNSYNLAADVNWATLTSAKVYTNNGVRYVEGSSNTYVIDGVKVVDVRTPATIAADANGEVASFDTLISNGYTATAMYTTDALTGVMTISMIIVTA